jgi:tetratricopeptide (TPR) repeat protein
MPIDPSTPATETDSAALMRILLSKSAELKTNPAARDELMPMLGAFEDAWLRGISTLSLQDACSAALALLRLYTLSGSYKRGLNTLARGMEEAARHPHVIADRHHTVLRAGLLLCRGNLFERTKQLAELEAAASEAQLLAKRARRPDLEAEALRQLAQIHWSNGNLAQMEKRLHAALKLATDVSVEMRHVEAKCCCDLSWCYACLGDPVASEMYATHAKETFAAQDNRHGVAVAQIHIADASIGRGDFERALRHLQQATSTFREFKDAHFENFALNNMAYACEQLGELKRARGLYERVLASAEASGNAHDSHIILCNLGTVACAMGDYPAAAGYATRAEAMALDSGAHDDDARLHMLRGDIAWHCGLDMIAHEHYLVAESCAYSIKRPEYIARALIKLAMSHQRAGRFADAERKAREAVTASRTARDKHMSGFALLALAYSQAGQARWQDAATAFMEVYLTRQRERQHLLTVEPLAGMLAAFTAAGDTVTDIDPSHYRDELLRTLDAAALMVALDAEACLLAGLNALAASRDARYAQLLQRANAFLDERRRATSNVHAFDAVPSRRIIAELAGQVAATTTAA